MLNKVDLTPAQAQVLLDAFTQDDPAVLHTEMSCNIASSWRDFLAVRYLPIPRMDGHGRMESEDRTTDVVLLQGPDGYVIMTQNATSGGADFPGAHTMEAHFVLASTLDFMPESRRTDWPLRVRRMRLDVIAWSLDQATKMSPAEKADFALWREIEDPASGCDFFGPDIDGLRKVLAGTNTVQSLWGHWAQDEADASGDLGSCLGTRGILDQLINKSAPRP